jgi:hypothetical protein
MPNRRESVGHPLKPRRGVLFRDTGYLFDTIANGRVSGVRNGNQQKCVVIALILEHSIIDRSRILVCERWIRFSDVLSEAQASACREQIDKPLEHYVVRVGGPARRYKAQ